MPGAVEQMRKAEISPLAGLPAPKEMLVDVARLEREYFAHRPDASDSNQMVKFGTSGHRGSPLSGTFTEAHILAITQAICDYRRTHGPDRPLFLGRDTHVVSEPAQQTALEVLAANGVNTIIQSGDLATPTPVISRTFCVTIADSSRAWRMASSLLRRTIRPRMADSSTTLQMAALPIRT
jgi:phosphoglucomutase